MRKRQEEHPEDRGVRLAPPVTEEQRSQLFKLGYRGPWPSTAYQARLVLDAITLRSTPAAEEVGL